MTLRTLPSLLWLYAAVLGMVAASCLVTLLAGCGFLPESPEWDLVLVKRYEDASGNQMPFDYPNLGYTFQGGDPDKYGTTCLINEVLVTDEDPDKIVRVIAHELLNVLVLARGWPDEAEYGWYVYDSDTLPPTAPIPEAEAEWVRSFHGPWRVHPREAWLLWPTEDAVERINAATGEAVFLIAE